MIAPKRKSKTSPASIDTPRFPNSKKVFVSDKSEDIRVPMREILQSKSPEEFGEELNEPIYVYDTSGPFSDDYSDIDIEMGLSPIRNNWIDSRNDTETIESTTKQITSDPDSSSRGAKLKPGEPRMVKTLPKCTTPARESLLLKWSLLPFAKIKTSRKSKIIG